MTRLYTTHRWVPHSMVSAYLLLGWLPLPGLAGTYHGQFAVHMAWACECPVVEPKREAA